MSGPTLEINTRLETNALLDRLVAPGETFSRDDARRLIDLIPVAPKKRVSFTGKFTSEGSTTKGHAAGVGDVEIKDGKKERRVDFNKPVEHKVGGYVVTHMPGKMLIELMWSQTKLDQSGQLCLLTYEKWTREPKELRISVQKTFSLFAFSFSWVGFAPWKRPAQVDAL
ncbi:hypothetical protein ACFOYU_04765 [Microvirga sp. GCM10011540]|uniref:hypothetical protein n=1 Tax=Microvirga sp. GCM10011540 TaxID=3317338 RepID=UPI00361B5B72